MLLNSNLIQLHLIILVGRNLPHAYFIPTKALTHWRVFKLAARHVSCLVVYDTALRLASKLYVHKNLKINI